MDTRGAVMGPHSAAHCCDLEAATGETKGSVQCAILGWRTSCHGNHISVIPESGHMLQNGYGLRCHPMKPEETDESLNPDPGEMLSLLDVSVSGHSPLGPANEGGHV